MHDWVWTTAPLQGPPPASLETGDRCLKWETLGLLDLVLLPERLAVSLAGNRATDKDRLQTSSRGTWQASTS